MADLIARALALALGTLTRITRTGRAVYAEGRLEAGLVAVSENGLEA